MWSVRELQRVRQYIEFEGIFCGGALGIFRLIRGFCDLRELASISSPYEMVVENNFGRVFGHQRALDERHAQDIKRYLEHSDNRFIPEIILSLRCDNLEEIIENNELLGVQTPADSIISIKRRFAGRNHRIQQIRIKRSNINAIKESKLIRRIDGNHRLALAEQLEINPNLPEKYLAPFCLILLGPTEDSADDYSESLIFHTINSTALPLESEHSLRLLLGQDPAHAMTPDNEFSYSPELHLTRLLSEKLSGLPDRARNRFGDRPRTTLWDAARHMIAMDTNIAENRDTLTSFADELFAALVDILPRLSATNPNLCQAREFLDLAALVWCEGPEENHDSKVEFAVQKLDRIGKWLGSQGITSLLSQRSPASHLLEIFNAVQNRVPKKLFLARWYPDATTDGDAYRRANLRLQMIKEMLDSIEREHEIRLELVDMGTEKGGTFPIHKKMYEAIASSDIIMCDLTGHRPNVFVEAGFALRHHEQNKLVFLFEPTNGNDHVPFDLDTFKYIQISQSAEIFNMVKPEILAILRDCGANI